MAQIRTPEEMFPVVESWLKSGLTQKAYRDPNTLLAPAQSKNRRYELKFIRYSTRAKNADPMLTHMAGPGLMLAIATPQQGQHQDLFEIQTLFEQLIQLLQAAGIN